MHTVAAMTLASLPCLDGARRVFTNQADIACRNTRGWGAGGVLDLCMAVVI